MELRIKSFLDGYKLQPIRVENSGDIYFMAYGYHSRGNHEGQVGVSFLHYKCETACIDEIFYIPVTFSEEILMKIWERLPMSIMSLI